MFLNIKLINAGQSTSKRPIICNEWMDGFTKEQDVVNKE